MAKRKSSQRQSNVHSPARRKRIERNQLTELILNGQLITTHHKAKELQKKIDRLVTIGKKDTVSAHRHAASLLRNVREPKTKLTAVQKLFREIAPKYKNRNGGYTRVLKLANRKGDNAPLSLISFV